MSNPTQRNRRRAGFTLIEVLLVIGLLLVLGTVGVTAYSRIQAGAERNMARTQVDQTVNAVKLYRQAMRSLPDEDEGLKALCTAPDTDDDADKWTDGGGPFFEPAEVPKDPWGNELKYVEAEDDGGRGFHVYSCGPNKEDDNGTDDDIPAWADE